MCEIFPGVEAAHRPQPIPKHQIIEILKSMIGCYSFLCHGFSAGVRNHTIISDIQILLSSRALPVPRPRHERVLGHLLWVPSGNGRRHLAGSDKCLYEMLSRLHKWVFAGVNILTINCIVIGAAWGSALVDRHFDVHDGAVAVGALVARIRPQNHPLISKFNTRTRIHWNHVTLIPK